MKLKRREFLQYVGAGAASIFMERQGFAESISTKKNAFLTTFNSPPHCIPLPKDGGEDSTDEARFKEFTAKDELSIPSNYVSEQLVSWGDTLGKNGNTIRIGYNCDHLSLVKRKNKSDEYFLVINHEYVSHLPWTESLQIVTGEDVPVLKFSVGEDFKSIIDGDMRLPLLPNTTILQYSELKKKFQTIAEKTFSEMGVSIVHVRAEANKLHVIRDSRLHRKIAGVTRSNVLTDTPMKFVGPGSTFLPDPRGTIANCSGATSPWNTVFTCEENIQDASPDWITPDGKELDTTRFKVGGILIGPRKTGIPLEWTGLGTCLKEPIDNRSYGWVCEIIPETGELIKYTSLGRFRHENVTFNARKGEPLKAYMGDDRRGGHVWKFESNDKLSSVEDPKSAKLLENGTLFCAKFNPGFTGEWLPLTLDTPLKLPTPEKVAEGYMYLPSRPNGGAVIVTSNEIDREKFEISKAFPVLSPLEWVKQIETYCKKSFNRITLGDLVQGESNEIKQLIVLMDAFLMANAIGGTPTARPEDLEVHPFDHSIYIAFADNTGRDQGSPDVSIFPDSKKVNSRQYGAVYRIEESPVPKKFTWGKFISSGEVAESGAGFACVDNLAFDRDGNLWFVTDISIDVHNHKVDGGNREKAGEKYFPGIFGNSSLFVVPTAGPDRGVPRLFATGPMESELTGIKFYEDENLNEFLLVAVQHPGELHGFGKGIVEERTIQLKTRNGRPFKQVRKVPMGSNFPGGPGHPPRPTVFAIYRKN